VPADVLRLVVTNLTRRKGRTIATALGIALGVATIVALLSIGSGLQRTAGEFVHLGQADFGVFQAGVADPTASIVPVGLAGRLQRRPDVAQATPLLLVVEAVKQDPAAVVDDQPRVAAEALEVPGQTGRLPHELDMGDEAHAEDEVDRPVADDLVGDADVAVAGVLRARGHRRRSLIALRLCCGSS
jgi:hypothetical protein